MHIIVPIKQVPETNAVKMDEKTGTMVRDGVEAIINPLDLYAIEIAISFCEKFNGEVTVVSMGPAKAESAIREAIAMGCNNGILVSDRAFGGADTWATSYVLAESIKKIGSFDLIICGERATDGDTGQVGPGIAAFLDMPVATYVSRIDEVTKSHCIAQRMTEEGYETLEIKLPAVLTVVKEVSNPRLPTLRGKLKAKSINIPVYSTKNLNLDEDKIGLNGSRTKVCSIFKPKVARKCIKAIASDEKTVENSVDELIKWLNQKKIL